MNKIVLSTLMMFTFFACTNSPKQEVNKVVENQIVVPDNFDIQGHRGARGLMPENTIEGFLEAINLGVNTIEGDVVVTGDKKLLFSHEPWFSSEISIMPNLDLVMKVDEENFNIYTMKHAEIVQFDVGRRINSKFPEQQHFSTVKPLFRDAILTIEKYCQDKNLPKIKYNIEIKSKEEWDNWMTPAPKEYVKIFLNELNGLEIKDRLSVQSFDTRILNELYLNDSSLCLAYLLETAGNAKEDLKKLNFKPCIISPNFKSIDSRIVKDFQSQGMKVIPWTVNDSADIVNCIRMGVNGMISDYPNRVKSIVDDLKKK